MALARYSIRSRKVGSAQCTSSNRRTSGRSAAAASISLRTAQKVSAGSAGGVRQPKRAGDALHDRVGVVVVGRQQPRDPLPSSSELSPLSVLRERLDDLAQRPEREPLAVGQAAAGGDPGLPAQRVREVVREAGLADARRAGDRHELTGPLGDRAVEGAAQQAQLGPATDQRRAQARARPGGPVRDREQAERRHGLALSLEVQRRHGLDLHRVADELERALADQDLVRRSRLLEPGCHVHRVAADEALAATGISGDHLAGVHAGSSLQPDAPALLQLLVQLGERRAHVGRRRAPRAGRRPRARSGCRRPP